MRLGEKIRERFTPEVREALGQNLRHPMAWLRGVALEDGSRIAPYELLIFAVAKFFESSAGGEYDNKQDLLYREVYRIPPKLLSIGGVVSSLWDASNDPFLGAWMDKRRLGADKLKRIVRISAVTANLLYVLKLLDGGLSPWGHIIVLILCNCLQDVVGTMDEVAGQKLRVSISPYTQQRVRVNAWEAVAYMLASPLRALPMFFMGFREVFGFSDYQIIVVGALIFMPLKMIASYMRSFVKVRVEFNPKGAQEETPPKRSWRETFAVLKHNRLFWVNLVCNFIIVFSPSAGDAILQFRYLAPSVKFLGRPMSGEGWILLRDTIAGVVPNILKPFYRQIINRFGGPLRFSRMYFSLEIIANLIKCMAGIKTVQGIILCALVENFVVAGREMNALAERMLEFEFFDYVELQTGERSEGISTAVRQLMNKTITNNIGTVTGNAALDWMGYRGGYLADGEKPPERFLKYIWPLATLAPAFDAAVWLVGRTFFLKWTPEDRARTEQALEERRSRKDYIDVEEAVTHE